MPSIKYKKVKFEARKLQLQTMPKKIDIILGFLIILLVILTIAFIYNPSIATFIDITQIFNSVSFETSNFWSIIGWIMFICFVGALIPWPLPYAIPIATFSYLWYYTQANPWGYIICLILLSALGNSLGDSLDYLIGNGASYFARKETDHLDRWGNLILKQPKLIPWVVMLFALTPLPDSVLLVPLGLVKYSLRKTLLFMYIGKVGQMIVVALAGIYGIEFLLNIVNGESGWIVGLILLYFIWVLMFIMVKVKIKPKN